MDWCLRVNQLGQNTESLMLNLAMWKRLSTWTGPILNGVMGEFTFD